MSSSNNNGRGDSISRFFQPRQDSADSGINLKRVRTANYDLENEGMNKQFKSLQPSVGKGQDFQTKQDTSEVIKIDLDEVNSMERLDKSHVNKDEVSLEQQPPRSASTIEKGNRFAQFAHNDDDILSNHSTRKKTYFELGVTKKSNSVASHRSTRYVSTSNTNKKKTKSTSADFVRMKDLSYEEQIKIVKKWHSLADSSAPLEVRRYQILLAARLHARCQEVTVRKAMTSLREAIPELNVECVAEADPEVLAHYISNLQFYNVKAKQVVQAAKEIKSRFQGCVPEDEPSLSQITGIGRCFADLLAFVNTRDMHTRIQTDK